MSSVTLSFKNTTFDIVDLDGQKWLRGSQIEGALGYTKADAIAQLYSRNADEFTPSMTALVKLPDLQPQFAVAGSELRSQSGNAGADLPPQIEGAAPKIIGSGQRREVRIFSLRGAHLLGMLANTEPAKDFRRWVLDVLEKANQPSQTMNHHLLAANSKLGVLMVYHQHGLSINQMAKLLNLSVRKVEQLMDKLTDCGLIPSTSPETQLELI